MRVVQWATGNIGAYALKGVIEHPDLELVGVWVHSDDKVGRDAGELCGLPPTSVLATNSIDDIVALAPDCVLYMPRQLDADEVCTLLASGANIVTTRGEFHRPASMDHELRARVEAACETGNSSIHSTGSSPGFITEALPLVLLSLQRRFGCITIDEFADLSGRNSPDLLFNIMGFGKEPTEFHPARLEHGRTSFGPSLLLVADHLGIEIDELQASGEFAVVTEDAQINAGTLPQGTVAGQRLTVAANRTDGTPALKFRATWYCTENLDQDWDLLTTGWKVKVEGDAPMDIRIELPIPLDQMQGYTANRATNTLQAMVDAPRGIRTGIDLRSDLVSSLTNLR